MYVSFLICIVVQDVEHKCKCICFQDIGNICKYICLQDLGNIKPMQPLTPMKPMLPVRLPGRLTVNLSDVVLLRGVPCKAVLAIALPLASQSLQIELIPTGRLKRSAARFLPDPGLLHGTNLYILHVWPRVGGLIHDKLRLTPCSWSRMPASDYEQSAGNTPLWVQSFGT